MAHNIFALIKRNVLTAGVVVCLPLLVAMLLLVILVWKEPINWGYGFFAILVAIILEYPYLKLCDRYIFK